MKRREALKAIPALAAFATLTPDLLGLSTEHPPVTPPRPTKTAVLTLGDAREVEHNLTGRAALAGQTISLELTEPVVVATEIELHVLAEDGQGMAILQYNGSGIFSGPVDRSHYIGKIIPVPVVDA